MSSVLPTPQVPEPPEPPSPPHPPHISIGRGGLHVPRAPHAPRIHPAPLPHAPGNPANQPPPARIVHIHQGTPPVAQPGAPSQAAQQRGHVASALGKRIAARLQGMPVENQRLFQTLIRAHGREHVRAYHEAGKGYLRDQIDEIKARSAPQPQRSPDEQARHAAAVNTTRAAADALRNPPPPPPSQGSTGGTP